MNQYPIVLSHGIARLDVLSEALLRTLKLFLWDRSNVFDKLHYFRGIASFLEDNDFTVYKSSVRFAAPVEDRAQDLQQEVERILEESCAEKVHIIGHSMGGLDARHMIVDEGMADRVASLTTIGTPHLGTRFADWGKEQHLDGAIKMLRELIDLEGFLTLTTADTVAFNRRSEHFEATNDVFYQTYASFEEKEHVFGLLRFSWKKIAEQKTVNEDKKKNDGLVPLHSQRWTDKLVGNNGEIKQITQHDFPFPADHLNQIGWWDFDELNKSEWWKVNLLEEKKAFEMAVRQVYLQIANDVKAL